MSYFKEPMRIVLFLFLLLSGGGCTIIGTHTIHSPTSDSGNAWAYRHVHGGAQKNEPPDTIIFTDSTAGKEGTIQMLVRARTIRSKVRWGGFLIPFIPLHLFRSVDYYRDNPDKLYIELQVFAETPVMLNVESLTLMSSEEQLMPYGMYYTTDWQRDSLDSFTLEINSPVEPDPDRSPVSYSRSNNRIEIEYNRPAENTDYFELDTRGILINGEPLFTASLVFKKMRQKWTTVGP
ncbi:MAG: hypothetical protein AAFW89_10050 [Bacteroidota bacterium]